MGVIFEKISEKVLTEKEFLMTVDYDGKEADIDPDEDLEAQVDDMMKKYKTESAEVMQRWCKQISSVEKVATFDHNTRTITIIIQKMIF